MLKWILFILSVLLSLSRIDAQVLPISHDKNLQKEVAKIIRYDTDIDWYNNEGAIIIVNDGEEWKLASYGVYKNMDPVELLRNKAFCLGGVSKTITARALRNLELPQSRKEMVLDSILESTGLDTTINLNDLLSHTSGFSRDPRNLELGQKEQNPYEHYTPGHFEDALSSEIVNKGQYLYSHTSYILLGWLYELLAKESISDFWTKLAGPASSDIEPGFTRAGAPSQSWTTGIYTPALGLWATPEQLAVWLQMNVSESSSYIGHASRVPSSYHEKINIGDSWHILDYEKYPIILHSGKASGHSAFVGFVKHTKTGVIVLSNHQKGTEDLGLLVLRMINKNWKRKR